MRKDKIEAHDDSAYPQKSGKANVFAFIICILLAVIIWLYVVNKDPYNAPGDPPHNDTNQGEVTE